MRQNWETKREVSNLKATAAMEAGRKVSQAASVVDAWPVLERASALAHLQSAPRNLADADLVNLNGLLLSELRRREAIRLATLRGQVDLTGYFR